MGQLRASKQKVTATSPDKDEEASAAPGEDEEPVKPQRRTNGKLKPVKKGKATQLSSPAKSTQSTSSQKRPAAREGPKTKPKAATAKKEPPKPAGKPIYSFFNAATQRQQGSQESARREKSSTPQEQVDAILDDSGDDANVTFSKASKTALTVRKRKVQQSESFEDDATLPPPATQKFRKTSETGRTPSFAVVNEDKRPWTEQFAPFDLTELSVHKRKVGDVRQWLESAFNSRRRKVLVLKGVAGTGKTATIRLLAKDMGFGIAEWRNPSGFEQQAEGSSTSTAQFEEFVRRAGGSEGLTLSTGEHDTSISSNDPTSATSLIYPHTKQILLIEEFPNTFSRTSTALQSFRAEMLRYVASSAVRDHACVPIVLVISETLLSTNTAAADSFTAHRLLGPELVTHPSVNTIEFNPVAPTILTKALETIVVKEARKSGRHKTPGPQVLKYLAETGDIRSAVSSLEFLCLRGDDGDIWSSKVAFTKPKKAKTDPPLTKSEEEALKLITNRESTLGIFHAVGRVVYNKRSEPTKGDAIARPPSWLPQHRRPTVPETNVDLLIDELGTDTPTFLAALHENYALSCSDSSSDETLESLNGCIQSISDADLFSVDRFSFGTRAFSGSATDSLRQDEISFQVAVRGLLFSLPSPVHRSTPYDGRKADAHRMFYPASLKLWKQREELEGILELLTSRVQSGSLDQLMARQRAKPLPPGSVETWKRTHALNQPSSEPSADSTDSVRLSLSSVSKSEMLLERLPFMSHILSSRKSSQNSTVLEQVSSVTRVQGQPSAIAEDDETGMDEAEDSLVNLEQWTTDKPDADPDSNTRHAARRGRTKGKAETEGDGLSIPVEHQVEKLVLEDDDIVDD